MRLLLLVAALCLLLAAPLAAAQQGGFRFSTDPAIAQVMPEKPVKVKIKRLSGGNYAWEITGEDVREVLRADEELRKGLGLK